MADLTPPPASSGVRRCLLPPGIPLQTSEEQLLRCLKKRHNLNPQSPPPPPPPPPPPASTSLPCNSISETLIKDLDLYDYDPSNLHKTACFSINHNPFEKQWYCFVRRERNPPMTRRAGGGCWKCEGDGGPVDVIGEGGRVLGSKRTFSFYRCLRPTDWVLCEYDLFDSNSESVSPKDAYVLCCVFREHKKKLNHVSRYHNVDNLTAVFNNEVGSPFKAHAIPSTSGNENGKAEEMVVGEEDDLHRLLMEFTDETGNLVESNVLPQENFSNEALNGSTIDDMNEFVDPVILEGDFFELADLLP